MKSRIIRMIDKKQCMHNMPVKLYIIYTKIPTSNKIIISPSSNFLTVIRYFRFV